jgi:hypothetical protein
MDFIVSLNDVQIIYCHVIEYGYGNGRRSPSSGFLNCPCASATVFSSNSSQ